VELSSDAFVPEQPIPSPYSCEGGDRSLRWAELPSDAISLASILDDPDAPVGTFTHWVAWGIEPAGAGLAEGERGSRKDLERAIAGNVAGLAELIGTYER
jgi:phosphatidylethanolamine-binding protein (PEBP) family uncharacterized protein